MADGTVVIKAEIDDKKAQSELNRLEKQIQGLDEKLNQKKGEQSAVEAELKAAREEAEKTEASINALKEELAEIQNITSINNTAGVGDPMKVAQAMEREKEVKEQLAEQEKLLKQQDADAERIANRYAAITDKVNELTGKQDAAMQRAGELAAQLAGVREETDRVRESSEVAGETGAAAAEKASSAIASIGSRIEKITHRILGLARRVFFFSLFTKAFRSVREYISSALKSSEEFTSALGQLKGALATAFQPIISAITPALTALINALVKVVSLIASVISLLFGTTISNSKAAAKSLNEETAAIKGVGGAAAKAGKQLANFDEINQLKSGNGGSDVSISFDFPTLEDSDVFQKIKRLVDSLDFSKLLKSWERLKTSAKNLWDTLSRGFGWVWDNVLAPLAQWTINELAPRAVDLLARAFDLLGVALDKFGKIFKPVWDMLLKPFFKALGEIALGGIEALTGFLEDLADAIDDFELSADGFGKFVEDVFGAAGTAIGNFGIDSAEAVGGFIDKLQKYTDVDLSGFKRTVLFEINYLALKIEAFCLKAGWLFGDLVRLIGHLIDGDMEAAKEDFDLLIHDAGVDLNDECVGMAKTITKNTMEGKTSTQDLGKAFRDLCIDARNEFPQTESAVKGFTDGVSTDMNNTLTPLQRFWEKLTGILGTLQSLAGLSVTNRGLLGLLSGNGWSFDIGETFGLKVPHLASGAVIPPNREFLAVLGDQKSGTNIEAPLDTLVEAFRQANDGGSATFAIYLDGEKIAENTVRRINRNARGTGKLGYV